MDVTELLAAVTRARKAGQVVVHSAPHDRGEDVEHAVRDLLRAPSAPLDLDDDDELEAIDAQTARRLLEHVLRFDLAHGNEVADAGDAARFADRVIDALPEPARWWTNGTVGLPGGGAWTPLTSATFDTGVIGASHDHILIVWFMDED